MLDDTQDTGARTNTTHHAGAGAYPSGIQGDGVHDNTHPPYPRDGALGTTTRDAGARTSGADADVRAAGGLDPAGAIVAQANEAPTAERPVEGVVQVLSPRQVPLGGLRALEVRRTLPHRDRSFVGAWCFVDHYGPERGVGMDVPPHPHTGLQTVSWLFEGAIEHHDSGGAHAVVRPGEVNLMTSGHGIVHSEVSTPGTETLHGVQLWVALPDVTRDGDRAFEHHAPECVPLPSGQGSALVFIGELRGVADSPIVTHTPLLGAELRLDAGARVTLDVDEGFEHGILVDTGTVTLDGARLERGDLGCVDEGRATLTLDVGNEPARVILLGGTPFEEEIVMWWNFIGRSHDEIVLARDEYEAGAERFGSVEGYVGDVERIPAPTMPPVRLRPRNRRGRGGG